MLKPFPAVFGLLIALFISPLFAQQPPPPPTGGGAIPVRPPNTNRRASSAYGDFVLCH